MLPRSRRIRAIAWVACLMAVGGCTSVRVTGATADDTRAEAQYETIYAERITELHVDSQPLASAAADPGVCNSGGNQRDCYEVDAKLIKDLNALLDALETVSVPPRYAAADRLLKVAIAEDIQGLELRNQAITAGDNLAWSEHKVILDKALKDFQAAYQAFPSDHRPQPPP